MLSMPSFTFLQELKRELYYNADFISFQEAIQRDPAAHPDFTVTQKLILQKGSIWLPKGLPFIKILLDKFHKIPTRGHGYHKDTSTFGGKFHMARNQRRCPAICGSLP